MKNIQYNKECCDLDIYLEKLQTRYLNSKDYFEKQKLAFEIQGVEREMLRNLKARRN